MSGVFANCCATKWHRRRGSNRNDGDDQKGEQSKPSYRPHVRSPNHAFGLWFVFVKAFYVQPPVSVALPLEQGRDGFFAFFVFFVHVCTSLFLILRGMTDS